MSVEALARVLADLTEYGVDDAAERIIRDPGPLLAALAEAGVLSEGRRERAAMVYEGGKPVDCVLAAERRYVTDWQEGDR